MKTFFVYIIASRSRRLYTGVTNDLTRRLYEHKSRMNPGFASRYRVDRLMYFEETNDPEAAITREKQIKSWRREKKIALIESQNPGWVDLSPGLDIEDSSLRSE
jgi:putative endonuclease